MANSYCIFCLDVLVHVKTTGNAHLLLHQHHGSGVVWALAVEQDQSEYA